MGAANAARVATIPIRPAISLVDVSPEVAKVHRLTPLTTGAIIQNIAPSRPK